MSLDSATRRILPWLVAIAFFMQALDGTILNTALPAMASDLGESPLRMQSVVVAYMLTVALLIPASGWLADRFGTRKVFSTAIVLFTLGSLLCALSQSLTQLVASRVVQGVGGALLLPVGRLAILRVFPKVDLLAALTFVAIPGLIGPLVGPTLGGWLVQVASWHWVFLVNLPVGAVGLLVARRFMPDLRLDHPAPFDRRGFLLFSAGLVLVSLALEGLGDHAISKATSLLMLVGGLAAMVGYWLHASRTPEPLFSLALMRIPTFSIGIAGNLFTRLGSGAMPFLLPIFLQVGLGYSPSKAGMSMIPSAIGAIFCKSIAVRLIKRLGYRNVLVGNTLLLGCAIASFGLVSPETLHVVLLVQLFIFGVFNSMQFSAMNTLTLGDLEGPYASSGNSMLSVVQQLAMSLGVAVGGTLLAAFSGERFHAASHEMAANFHATFLTVGGLTMLAAVVFWQLKPREAPAKPETVVEEG